MKFSVIIPTYKRIGFLKKALESVAMQVYSNYEIIVVNDNPADKKEIDDLCGKLKNTTVIHHVKPRGGNAARNTGILHSTGDILAFLDDDDIWMPDKLSKHAAAHHSKPEAGLVFSDCLYVFNNPLMKDNATCYHINDNVVELMKTAKFCPATSSMVTIRRACVSTCGVFDESLSSLQDWDYWFRIAHYYTFEYIPVVLVHFTQHPGDRTSQNKIKRMKGLQQISCKWKSEIDVRKFSKELKRDLYYKSALNILLTGEKFNAFKTSLSLFKREVFSYQSFKSFSSLLLRSLR